MKATIQKITDIATIVCPAIIAGIGVVSKVGAGYASAGVEILMIVLGAASSIASVVYNVTKETK